METPKYNSEGQRVYESPVCAVETADGRLELHWLNTRCRLFEDSQYDHVEVTKENGSTFAFKPPTSFLTGLMDNKFPYDYSPVVDDDTFEWYNSLQTSELDKEIEELMG